MPEQFATWYFPKCGIDLSAAFSMQTPRQLDGSYVMTTRDAVNVRAWDNETTRMRGCARSGISKFVPATVRGIEWVVQDLNPITTVLGQTDRGGDVQNSLSGRVVFLVAVSQGYVYTALPGETEWTPTDNQTGEDPPLSISGLMYSSALNQKLWFVDGVNYAYFDPVLNQVLPWVATAGTLPQDEDGLYARLICTWRGRIVLSGIIGDPQNWFMSAVSEPLNFDYSPSSPSSTQAVAGNNSSLGIIGDVVTCLIPYSDDVLIFGGDHTIYMMRGDPMAGGQIDLISDSIGMAFGMPWCKDPYGTVYFFSNRCGVYSLVPGQAPVRISQAIEQLLLDIDTGANSIRLLWNDRYQGLHVFITNIASRRETTHFFYEVRTQAWWKDQFASTAFDPLCCCVLDGNEATDRVPLIGCWDGFVRALDPFATKDDYLDIESSVVLGPIVTQNLDDMMLMDMQAVIGESASPVTWEVFVGETAEAALDGEAVATGTWKAGRNPLTYIRRSGHAIYVKLSSSDPWAMENIRARIATEGRVRMRGLSA